MRKLMWFSIGFAVACAVGAYLLSGMWLILLGLLFVGVAVVFALAFHKPIPAILAVGLAVGFLYYFGFDQIYLDAPRSYNGESVNATVTISDYSYDTDYGVAADGIIDLGSGAYRVKVYYSQFIELKPGDTLTGKFRLRYTAGMAENATYHKGDGIFLLAYADESTKPSTGWDPDNIRYLPARLRISILERIDLLFPEDTAGFAKALILGDTSGLTYEQDTAFKISGIRHVIAVSGLHVSILFSLIYLLSGKKRFFTAVFGIPALLLFAALAGFTPSIVRACIMQTLMILALLFNREYDPPTALAFAVLVMLAVNPLAITSVSLQLSVGCMIGIFLFTQRIYRYFTDRIPSAKKKSFSAKIFRAVAASVSVSLGAMSVTTPLSAFYFGMVSIVGVLTNIIALWMISIVFYGIMIACITGFAWLSAGQLVAGVIAWPIRYVLSVADIMSKPLFAAVYSNSVYIVIWLIFCYVMLTAFLLSKKKRPMLFAACCIIGLLLSVGLSCLEPRLDNYRITVLDVGQGQSVLIQSGGKYYLVDCGGDSAVMAADTAAQALLSQGVDRLNGLILTHYDKDHAAGAPLLLSRIEVDDLYLPDTPDDGPIKELLKTACNEKIHWITDNQTNEHDNVSFSLFPSKKDKPGNESGMCILFQIENCDILITGDRSSSGERELLEQTQLPELELLIVGHHGASDATGFALLEQTKPKAAVISVGTGNGYGHPSSQTLNKLKLFHSSVSRTDLDGTIIYRG